MALPTCHHCQEPIEQAQLLRVGPHRFHPDHFVCKVCGRSLRDQKFHFKDGGFYCSEDFQAQFSKKCHKCGDSIRPGHVIQAFGKFFHPEHFCCEVCNKSFENGRYYELEGAAYCADHYLTVASGGRRCHKCDRHVGETDAICVQNKVFHTECLFCRTCNRQLEGAVDGSVFQHLGELYCRADYLVQFAQRCTRCGEHIVDNCITANDEHYHRGCFQCSVCERTLDKYIRVGAHLRCEDHLKEPAAELDCSLCGLVIHRDPVLACGQRRHAQGCFKCADCGNELNKAEVRCRPADPQALLCAGCFGREIELLNSQGGLAAALAQGSPGGGGSITATTDDDGRSPTSSAARQQQQQLEQPPSPQSGEAPPTQESPPAKPPASPVSASPKPQQREGQGEQGEEEQKQSPLESESQPGGQISSVVGGDGSPPSSPASPASTSSRPSAAPPTKSSTFGKCQIAWKRGDEIGRGAFGRVYMALIEDTGELIAVKQVKLSKYDDNLQLILSMESEIALMETLRHPNIVTLLGTQRKGNKFNILMEYVPGNSLDKILSKFGAFSEKVVKSYTAQLLSALAYCHANNVVHRDIKAKNILVDTKGTLKLADFGSAKRFENVMSKAAPSLSYNYTPLWTAPEVLTGRYDSKVDIWSLGCVIVEMGSGQPPWSECAFENPFRALYHIGNSGTIPKLPKKLSPLGQTFLKLCLTRDPDERPSAEQLLLHPWIVGEAVSESAAAAAGVEGSSPVQNGKSARRQRRRQQQQQQEDQDASSDSDDEAPEDLAAAGLDGAAAPEE